MLTKQTEYFQLLKNTKDIYDYILEPVNEPFSMEYFHDVENKENQGYERFQMSAEFIIDVFVNQLDMTMVGFDGWNTDRLEDFSKWLEEKDFPLNKKNIRYTKLPEKCISLTFENNEYIIKVGVVGTVYLEYKDTKHTKDIKQLILNSVIFNSTGRHSKKYLTEPMIGMFDENSHSYKVYEKQTGGYVIMEFPSIGNLRYMTSKKLQQYSNNNIIRENYDILEFLVDFMDLYLVEVFSNKAKYKKFNNQLRIQDNLADKKMLTKEILKSTYADSADYVFHDNYGNQTIITSDFDIATMARNDMWANKLVEMNKKLKEL